MRRGDSKLGRIPVPPVEVVELDDRLAGAVAKPTSLRAPASWIERIRVRIDRSAARYVLAADQIPAEILQGREDFAMFEFDPDGRPVVQVLPGMTGDLRIGVSRMTVEHMLADPAFQLDTGGARLPLPYGARLRIHCGPKTFVAKVGTTSLTPSPDREASHSLALA